MFLDRRNRLVPIDLNDPFSALLLKEFDLFSALKSFHLVSSDGNVLSGSLAIPQIIYLLTDSSKAKELFAYSPIRYITQSNYLLLSRLKGASRCGVRRSPDRFFLVKKKLSVLSFRTRKRNYLFKEVKPFVHLVTL